VIETVSAGETGLAVDLLGDHLPAVDQTAMDLFGKFETEVYSAI